MDQPKYISFHWLGEKWCPWAPIDSNNFEDVDRVLLCSRPSQTTLRYTSTKAYGNHFRVEDSKSILLFTYDNGIALVFDMPSIDTINASMNYVGVLKNIFKLYYGPMRTPMILFMCEWIKWRDNWGNPILCTKWCRILHSKILPQVAIIIEALHFSFSNYTSVFFCDIKKRSWKIFLWKEAWSRREVADTEYVFITTTMETSGLSAWEGLPPLPSLAS